MDIYAPNCYKDFKCIASSCKHSCCVGWNIYVDEASLEKYKKLNTELGAELMRYISKDSDGAYIERRADGGCPMLNQDGLCRLIIAEGEEYLCDICRLHPRFYNEIGGRTEVGLGLACEEACRLILLSKEPFHLVKAGENESVSNGGFDALAERDSIIEALLRTDIDYNAKLLIIKEKYGVSTDFYSVSEWIKFFSELEILDSKWSALLAESEHGTDAIELCWSVPILERFLIYSVFRHVSAAADFDDLRARLGFALISAEMLARIYSGQASLDIDTALDIARMYSSEIEYSEDNTAALIFEFECRV